MIKKKFKLGVNKWFARRAFNALILFVDLNIHSPEEHKKLVEVLDILRMYLDKGESDVDNV